jgi:intracellular septation protein
VELGQAQRLGQQVAIEYDGVNIPLHALSPVKALFDFFPVAAFFGTYMAFGQDIYLATKVMMAATLAQMAYLVMRRLPIRFTHVISAVLAWGLGGMALIFHNALFIKWKPTVVYWMFAAVFLGSQFIGDKPIMQRGLEHAAQLDSRSWRRLNIAWAIFFALMGALNLYVVYNFSEAFWVKYKLFGGLGLTLAFSLAQGVWIASRVPSEQPESPGGSGAQ